MKSNLITAPIASFAVSRHSSIEFNIVFSVDQITLSTFPLLLPCTYGLVSACLGHVESVVTNTRYASQLLVGRLY